VRRTLFGMSGIVVAWGIWAAFPARAQNPAAPATPAAPQAGQEKPAALEGPPPIPNVPLGPMLRTVPVRRGSGAKDYNWVNVDTALAPVDKDGIWVLQFAFHPVRIVFIDIPGKGRRPVHYLYYRVINRGTVPRMFVPQFTLVTDATKPSTKRYEDVPLPSAVRVIQAREDFTIPLHDAVSVMGMIPPSGKEGIDDAVYGVATWIGVDPKADSFSIYVRGLSDGHKVVEPPQGGKPQVQYKTLRIDFIRRGDQHNINEKEIELLDPPYDWIYW
jgi:hypothetical protein